MAIMRAVQTRGDGVTESRQLFERIGEFLFDQRLDPTPGNYSFAYHLLVDPTGPLAEAVARLTDGGVRLTQRDIESFDVPDAPAGRAESDGEPSKADKLVARTQMQIEGFEDIVRAIKNDTQDFGRDLAESAAAIDATRGGPNDNAIVKEVARITAGMIKRVHSAESQLESATREATELRSKLEEARENARRDPLTGLPNRRAFEEAFATQSAAGAAIVVAICDVDHFKSVNDRFGHEVGDRVLQTIGQSLTEACSGHLVTRYGGEEFAILFADLDMDSARATIDAARVRISSKRYRVRDSEQPIGMISFSAGLATAAPGEALAPVFHRADSVLYSAKEAGRNQVRTSLRH